MLSLLKNGGFSRASGTIPDQQGQVAIAHLKRLSASFRLKPTFPPEALFLIHFFGWLSAFTSILLSFEIGIHQ
jgi:hypothetical protein